MPSGRKKVFVTKLTDTSTTDDEGVGVIRREGNKEYQWVLFNNGAGNVASAAGSVCYNYAVSGASTGSTTVTCDVTDSGGIGRGLIFSWKGTVTMSCTTPSGRFLL